MLQEQLTLGQLVAAELVVAMIIGSLTKLTKQIEGFFDVMASVDKLGHIADLPLEEPGTEVGQTNADVVAEFPIQALTTVSAGVPSNRIAKWQIRRGRHQSVISANETAKRRLTDVLFGIGESSVNSGFLFGTAPNAVLKDFQRRQVVLIREVEIFTGTVEENIHVGRTHLDHNSIAGAIKKVGLEERIHNLPHGLHTALNPDGTPLSPSEKVLLMVARGISGSPQILVIDRLLDQLPDQSAKEIIAKLQAEDVPWTLVLVTGRRDLAEKVDECIEVD